MYGNFPADNIHARCLSIMLQKIVQQNMFISTYIKKYKLKKKKYSAYELCNEACSLHIRYLLYISEMY